MMTKWRMWSSWRGLYILNNLQDFLTSSMNFENRQLEEENGDQAGTKFCGFKMEHMYFYKKLW